jgi:anaerobic ribonucleoside-triphosphate reductase activating protein
MRKFVVRSPEQGLRLIQHPEIVANWKKALRWRPKHKRAVLLPCAGTKPFFEAPSHKSGYLPAIEGKNVDVWVVSEPLGVVPYDFAGEFPNQAYDFPPRFLRGAAWDALVDRVVEWLEKVAPKYGRVFAALPGHHERLLRAALEIHNPGNVRNATHTQCLTSGACPGGHGRATSKRYRRFLKAVVKNPADTLNLAMTVQKTEAEGPGARFALWVRGCSIRCPGCSNATFFSADPDKIRTIDEVLDEIVRAKEKHPEIEGVTFLGGEPFEQDAPLAELARRVQDELGLSVMAFTGYLFEDLQARGSPLLEHVDILVDGPYVQSLRTTKRRFIGSTNQRLLFLTDRYSPDDPRWSEPNTAEIHLTQDGSVQVVGFPFDSILKAFPGAGEHEGVRRPATDG